MSKRTRHFWIEVVLLVLITAGIATAFLIDEMQPLNKQDIKMDVSDLRSFAAAGRQLLDQQQKGQLTQTFFDSQASLLKEKVSSTTEALHDGAEPAAERDRREASDLAAQLSAAVEDLEAGRSNGSSLGRVLEELKLKSKQLEDRLTNE